VSAVWADAPPARLIPAICALPAIICGTHLGLTKPVHLMCDAPDVVRAYRRVRFFRHRDTGFVLQPVAGPDLKQFNLYL
jgi:hypothetical protein